MAGSSKSNPPRPRKRVDAENNSLKRARDGSAFTRCVECNKNVPVVLIDMHSCSLDSKIKMHLESQTVERVSEAKKAVKANKAVKRRKVSSASEKKVRRGKDPNTPKRPPSSFILFMDDFRKEFKESNPDSKGVALVTKKGGERWKSMTDDEKKPYLDKAAEMKAEYEKTLEKYNAENKEKEDEVDDEHEELEDKDEELEDKEDEEIEDDEE